MLLVACCLLASVLRVVCLLCDVNCVFFDGRYAAGCVWCGVMFVACCLLAFYVAGCVLVC